MSERYDRVDLVRVAVPLRTPFATAAGVLGEREAVLVRLVAGGLEGWGEASPVPRYSPETIDEVWAELAAAGNDLLAGLLPPFRSPAARCAVVAARDDLAARRAGRPLWRHLGGTEPRVEAGAVLGLGSAEELRSQATAALAAGHRAVKVKIAPGRDVAPLFALRAAFPDLTLAADANGSYRSGDPVLAAVDRIGLVFLEQPLPAGDLAGLAVLARRCTTPIALDESLAGAGDAPGLVAMAPFALTLKAQTLGGGDALRRVHDAAAGHPLRIGGLLETGVGRAHSLALATLPGISLPSDLAPPTHYLAGDVTDAAWVIRDGLVHLPDGPGIGVAVLPDALAAATRAALTFP